MRAVAIVADGDRGAYEMHEMAEPEPGPRMVLIQVRAAALNRADVSQRAGTYRQEEADGHRRIAGLEVAGEVVARGSQSRCWQIGDRVMAMCEGGFAELVAVDERLTMAVPERLGWAEAAATPVALLTEHDAIATRGGLRPGDSVAIHGAGSGVGLIGIQVARELGAGTIFATLSSGRRADLVRELGADFVAEGAAAFTWLVAEHTADGVDLVVDHVGAELLGPTLEALAVGGRLISVGRLGGCTGDLDLDLLARRNLRLVGVSFRTRTIDQQAEIVARAEAALMPALAAGRIEPKVDEVFPFEQLESAQRRMISNAHRGKIVLTMDAG